MYCLMTASCVLTLGLLMPFLNAEEKATDNPAAQKLNRAPSRIQTFDSLVNKGLGKSLKARVGPRARC